MISKLNKEFLRNFVKINKLRSVNSIITLIKTNEELKNEIIKKCDNIMENYPLSSYNRISYEKELEKIDGVRFIKWHRKDVLTEELTRYTIQIEKDETVKYVYFLIKKSDNKKVIKNGLIDYVKTL